MNIPYQTLYTPEMAKDWRKIAKPFPFTVDVVENFNCLSIVIYSYEISKMNDMDRMKVMQYLYEVEALFNSYGVEVSIEGVHGEPGPI